MMSLTDREDFGSHYLNVGATRLHYYEQGKGDPVIFLHGVPTSAWVWRKVIPHLASLSRCIAPDLAGFGQSGQPDQVYTLDDQVTFLDGLIQALQLNRITFVLHGWGGLIGLSWAMQNPDRCRGLVLYETWIHSLSGHHLSLPYNEMIQFWKQDENLQKVATNGLHCVDQILRQSALMPFDENAMAHYCAPFSHTGAGKPLVALLSELPCGDAQKTGDQQLYALSEKLKVSSLPKLLLYSVPGFLMTIETIQWARKNLPALEVIEIGEELHYAQESQPVLMGETISAWLQGIEQMAASPKSAVRS